MKNIEEERHSKSVTANMKRNTNFPKKNSLVTKTGQIDQLFPPDGGWGWIVVVGAFSSMMFGSLPLIGFGILFSPLLSKFSVASTKIAWIFGVHSVVWNVFALLVGPLTEEFGWRKIALAGGAINFVSIFLSGFAPAPDFLFFSFSILGGVGGSTAITVSLIVVSRYFEKHRGFALGMASLGMCASAFISPLLANYLLDQYGYLGASLVFSAVVLNQCVSACVFQPVEWHMKSKPRDEAEVSIMDKSLVPREVQQEKLQAQRVRQLQNRKISELSAYSSGSLGQSVSDIQVVQQIISIPEETEMQDEKSSFIVTLILRVLKSTYSNIKTLKYARIIILAIGASCLMVGNVNFQMWIPFVVMDAGYSRQMAAWCVSATSISNVVGRISVSVLSEWKRFSVRVVYQAAIFFIGVFIVAFALVRKLQLLIIFACCWSFNVGAAMSLNPTVMIDVMGVSLFPAVFGVSSWMIAVACLVAGPVVGFIRDATSTYKYALCLIGSLEFFAVLLWLMMPLANKFDTRNQVKETQKELQL